jgi:UDP-glucose-4-epimerase GalE
MQNELPRRVLVTGGAGYIGSHTAKYLSQQGVEPVVLDNLSVGHRSAVRWGPFVECDLADRVMLAAVFRDYCIDAVIHFAAHCYVGESITRPAEYFRNNIGNTLNLLDAMHAAGVRTIVFSSSCATYGVPSQTPISEKARQWPINPYGESKLFVERALKWYGSAYGLKWAALRYFNAAGADPDGELGENHDPETHLIPLAIQTALGLRRELQVFGTDYPTPDGSAIRDYVHVWDLAAAHFRALEYLCAGAETCTLNLGTGAGCSVFQVIRKVEAVSGLPVPVRLAPRRDGDPPVLVADPRRAFRVLRWTPRLSLLERIVDTAFRWHNASCAEALPPRL